MNRKKIIRSKQASLKNIKGDIRIISSGNGIFIADKFPNDEFFIPRHFLRGSFNGDKVLIDNLLSVDPSFAKGRVVKILKRVNQRFRAIIYRLNQTWYANIDINQTKKIRLLDTALELEQYDIVDIEIDNWDAGRKRATASILNVICHHNDSNADLLFLTEKHQIPRASNKDALKGIKKISRDKILKIGKDRLDLRHLRTFTIDPEDARDFDDALSIQKSVKGQDLWVHISDVSAFVKPNTLVDKNAKERGNSYYFPEKVYHMLPEILSTRFCSLELGETRLSFSIKMSLDKDSNVKDYQILECLIKSDRSYAYEQVNGILKNNKDDAYSDSLRTLDKVTKIWKSNRMKNGGFEVHSNEWTSDYDNKGTPIAFHKKPIGRSQRIVEECMLMANKIIAKELFRHSNKNNALSLYRNHEIPSIFNENKIEKLFTSLDFKLSQKNKNITSKDIHKFLLSISNVVLKKYVSISILKKLKKAVYGSSSRGHYGLHFELYTHFTSPIRRYADLQVHRLMKNYIYGHANESIENLTESIESANNAEIRGSLIEREYRVLKNLRYLKSTHLKRFDAYIQEFSKFYIHIHIHIGDISGLIEINNLSTDRYLISSDGMKMRGKYSKSVFSIGQKLLVKLEKVDFAYQKSFFSIEKSFNK